jgi:myo-inositol catabolism protein IolS
VIPPSTSPVALARRPCGRSDLQLPILGVGCWAFGGGDYWGPQSQSDVNAVVRAAVEHGCGFFDTAESYNGGESERALGAALRGMPRHEIIVCTKVSPHHTAPETLVAHLEASLTRLGLDYVDLYMVHWPINASAIRHFAPGGAAVPTVPEAFGTLDALRSAGKIRHIGVSNFGRRQLDEALATGVPIAVNELPYSLLARAIEHDIIPHCRARGVGVLGYMSLLQGVLSDRYASLADVPEHRRRTRHFDGRSTPLSRHGTAGAEVETSATLHAIRDVARRLGLTTADLALKWACRGEGITSSLCGARNVAALEANLRAAASPLDEGVVAELDRVTRPLLDAMGPSFDYYENPANDRTA